MGVELYPRRLSLPTLPASATQAVTCHTSVANDLITTSKMIDPKTADYFLCNWFIIMLPVKSSGWQAHSVKECSFCLKLQRQIFGMHNMICEENKMNLHLYINQDQCK